MGSPAVLVTGASTGIGAATVRLLAGAGYVVYAGVRTDADMNRVGAWGGDVRPLRCDVTSSTDIAALAQRLDDDLGSAGLAGLVNNAGIAVGGPLELVELDELRRVFEVNVVGQLALTQPLVDLLGRARGRIVMIGSIGGRVAAPNLGPYSASKAALAALAESLRAELRPAGIRVVLIEPGAVATPIWEKGRAYAGELRNRLDPEALERYRTQLDHTERIIDESERHAVAPGVVARVIVRSLERRWPRSRVLVGADARVGAALLRIVPDRLRDLLVPRI